MHSEKYMSTVNSSVLHFYGSPHLEPSSIVSKNCCRQANIIDQKVGMNYRTMGLNIVNFNSRPRGRKINKEIDTQTNATVKLEVNS